MLSSTMHKCIKHNCPNPETCKCRRIRHAQLPIIWLIGGAGSGKRAVGSAMNVRHALDYFSSGVLLRQETRSGSRQAAELERTIAAGTMIDDTVIVELLEKSMKAMLPQSHGYIVSFAKTVVQAELFERYIAPVDVVIYLECTDETLMARSKERAKEAGTGQDVDDEEAVIALRIQKFRETLAELQQRYEKKWHTINAERDLETVLIDVEPLITVTMERKLAEKLAEQAAREAAAAEEMVGQVEQQEEGTELANEAVLEPAETPAVEPPAATEPAAPE